MSPLYGEVALRAGHRCEYCHTPEAVFNFAFEVEHITPVCRGGDDANVNLALSCRVCNLRKSTHITGVDPESAEEVRLFDPRRDVWDEHFQIDADSGRVLGLTQIGRASVVRLEMNSAVQLKARHQWIRLGLYP
jgi:hypothetical protein